MRVIHVRVEAHWMNRTVIAGTVTVIATAGRSAGSNRGAKRGCSKGMYAAAQNTRGMLAFTCGGFVFLFVIAMSCLVRSLFCLHQLPTAGLFISSEHPVCL